MLEGIDKFVSSGAVTIYFLYRRLDPLLQIQEPVDIVLDGLADLFLEQPSARATQCSEKPYSFPPYLPSTDRR